MRGYRFKWWHLHATLATIGIALLVAFLAGVFAANYKNIFGAHLNKQGQTIYHGVAQKKVEHSQRTQKVKVGGEFLSQEQIDRLNSLNNAAAQAKTAGPPHPVPLAAKEPINGTFYVRNYSSRNGTRPALLVVHDTESPNVPGTQDVLAIVAWFNNVASQASSNYTTDAEGNTYLLVRDTAKAWTQAFFNPWSISDELIGHASQTAWPESQLRVVAKLFAGEAAKWGIPVQLGQVAGCRIVRAGIVQHSDLGQCGGGHHDAGPQFPMRHFIALVKQYRDGGFHPLTKKELRVKLRAYILKQRRTGVSWAKIKQSAQYKQYVAVGGH